jgi:hypothetical protein
MYDDVQELPNAREVILDFLESAYHAGAVPAGWEIDQYKLRPLEQKGRTG